MKTQISGVEEIVKEGLANHFRGLQNVSGRLTLTNRRLTFKSNLLSLGKHEVSYPLADIAGLATRNTLFVIPNGLSVIFRDGHEERFLVYGRKDWITKIAEARAKI